MCGAEAVLDTLEDMMDFDEEDFEDEDESPEEPAKSDDPEVDPYKSE